MTRIKFLSLLGIVAAAVMFNSCDTKPQLDAEALSEKSIGMAAGDSLTAVREDLTLPTTGENGSEILWLSDNPAAIVKDGKVTISRPNPGEADITVNLTAIIISDKSVERKTFAIVVKAWTMVAVEQSEGKTKIMTNGVWEDLNVPEGVIIRDLLTVSRTGNNTVIKQMFLSDSCFVIINNKYKKAEELITLPENMKQQGFLSIAVEGDDIYVAGAILPAEGPGVPISGYWKNKVWNPDTFTEDYFLAMNISVANGIVYRNGKLINTTTSPTTEKNGYMKGVIFTEYKRGEETGEASTIIADGENIFCVSRDNTGFWKNGEWKEFQAGGKTFSFIGPINPKIIDGNLIITASVPPSTPGPNESAYFCNETLKMLNTRNPVGGPFQLGGTLTDTFFITVGYPPFAFRNSIPLKILDGNYSFNDFVAY